MFTKQPTMDMDIEFDIKLLATEYYEGTVCIRTMKILSILFFLLLLLLIRADAHFASNKILQKSNRKRKKYRESTISFSKRAFY